MINAHMGSHCADPLPTVPILVKGRVFQFMKLTHKLLIQQLIEMIWTI